MTKKTGNDNNSNMKTADLVPEQQYRQSANSLFHFMKEEEYLFDALVYKMLFPRYCNEDIEYLKLEIDGKPIKQISVLQKCFCDIPLHQLTAPMDLSIDDTEKNVQTVERYSHPDFYGKYAIAFSKQWCINHNLQPVHYVNPQSSYVDVFKKAFEHVIRMDDIDDSISCEMLSHLAYFKPLWGVHLATPNGRVCGTKRPRCVSERPQ